MDVVGRADILGACDRIAPFVIRTPLVVSAPMSERTGATIAVKAEHRQLTGSFKLRGSLNKILSLSDEVARRGVVTASSGNHGIGVATAAAARGVPCSVYLPTGASPAKIAAIGRLGATIITVDGDDTAIAERAGRAAAADADIAYVSPYNDPEIIAGQGTLAVEVTDDAGPAGLDHIDALVAAVGGGGLISGIASWMKARSPDTEVVGASPLNDHAMAASVAAGSIIEPSASPTFSDGTAGAVEAGSITFALCRSLVDRWLTVTEPDIARAVAAMIDDHHELVEGAAGVALAAAHQYGLEHPGATIVVVSCGANVSSPTLSRMLTLAGADDHEPG